MHAGRTFAASLCAVRSCCGCVCGVPTAQEDHISSFDKLVAEAKTMSPLLINSHSGCDLWSFDSAVTYFEHALKVCTRGGGWLCVAAAYASCRALVLVPSPSIAPFLMAPLVDLAAGGAWPGRWRRIPAL